jgi:hypothetical protein
MPERKNSPAALALLLTLAAGLNLQPAAIVAAQQPTAREGATDAKLVFRSAAVTPEETPDGLPAAFDFSLSGYAYQVRSNGAGRRTKDGKTRLFNLRLEGGDAIRHIYFAEYERNVLLVCEVSDGERGAGFVVRLEQPSMRARWRREVPGPNIGRPLLDKTSLYLTAARFVARLDPETGEYVWRHAGLGGRAEPEATTEVKGSGDGAIFSAFAVPEVAGEEVLFRELPVYNRAPKAIRVERRSGRIVRIE